MNWQAYLSSVGAQWQDTDVTGFGQPAAEIQALEQTAVLVPLVNFGLIRLSGPETIPFLHGQVSSDVKKLPSPGAHFSTYSTPKGRMLASMLIVRHGDDLVLQLPAALVPAIQKRLSMYILRSKTRAEDVSGTTAVIGLAGPQAAAMLANTLGIKLAADYAVAEADGTTVIRLPGDRFLVQLAADAAPTVWAKLVAAGAVPAGVPVWTLSDIRAGIVWVLPGTQEEFVPQMANMELIGAVNFQKGCYPGQEIVARTQYLGKLKKRAFRVVSTQATQPGDAIFSADMNGQASGLIALAAPAGPGKWESLAVAQLGSVEHGLHLESPEGPQLDVLPLPYAVRE
ncbi:MAG: folate-binding protein YgfZ [Burkholderiales bacterium]|nr:folate-binding protein YgfZ [Burkholderiales bacterium]